MEYHLQGDPCASFEKAYTHLKSVMNYALKRRWIREESCDIEGASNYRPPVEPETPTDTEVALMLELADQPMRTILALAAHCGHKKGEILGAQAQRHNNRRVSGRNQLALCPCPCQGSGLGRGNKSQSVPQNPRQYSLPSGPKTGGARTGTAGPFTTGTRTPETL